MKISAGIIIKYNNKILLGHSTGNAFWDIPKGQLDENEDPKTAAVRETFEETNIKVNPESLIDLGQHKYIPYKKDLHLYILNIDGFLEENNETAIKTNNETHKVQCNSKFTNKYDIEIPELDDFKFVDFNELSQYCTKNMYTLLAQVLDDYIAHPNNNRKPKT